MRLPCSGSQNLPQRDGEGREIKIKCFLLLLSAAQLSPWNPLAQEIKGGMSTGR